MIQTAAHIARQYLSTTTYTSHIPLRAFATILLTSMTFSLGAQQKFEKETRADMSQVPPKAIAFVDAMSLSSKIKWYKEYGIDKTSYEAKTKFDGKRLSIEFSNDGAFEDLEVEIRLREIPGDCRNEILGYLDAQHSKYKIKRAQVQYSGNNAAIQALRFLEKSPKGMDINYEIVVSTKVEGSYTMFEYLFDEQGSFVRRSRIIQDMTDNLDY